ncbi:hypothetical protein [Pedobacter montanisoli]|uniref:Uncharacterized protein n=1 Tax=Pedobacter montanisoli TaxID=2923277 RepID=A0ABS9ZW98_9SPHI|nr:hypothetical protein [Pedobacter montanisoli]MCJ0742584.1 hypothetical protein [Pedobacter montanisoli]
MEAEVVLVVVEAVASADLVVVVLAEAEAAEAGKPSFFFIVKEKFIILQGYIVIHFITLFFYYCSMYRRDLLKSEIERLAQVLARIMGLKLDGKPDEALAIFNETIQTAFLLDETILNNPDLDHFKDWLNKAELSSEKLDSLSEFLYYELGTSAERNKLIAPKLNLIYLQLSEQYKVVHLVNLHRQEIIQQYL